ncbi:MAG: hypothetical protein HGA45_31825 [Chloroflexales bacterium]|nr:hypothetical protein [Chloroflexales bacterium]
MNNAGAIYVELGDHAAIAAALTPALAARGFARVSLPPGAISGRIMIREKRRRLFFVLPPRGGWVAVFEDPRYFGERALAKELARTLSTRTVWIEVSGNGVGWARAIYYGDEVIEEHYDEVETNFYGEYGPIAFVYDIETTPEEFIAALGLPYDDYDYESLAAGELPAEAGTPIHLAFERV